MSGDARPSDEIRKWAEQQGLQRALAMFPDQVAAAAERAQRPFGKPPAGLAPLTAPAPVFDPVFDSLACGRKA